MVAIVDYGMGNTGSIKNMLKRAGCTDVHITNDKKAIEDAERLILPGVGAFDTAMKNIHELELLPVLNEQVLHKQKPILGICLGMQLLSNGSEEGGLKGLGWIDGYTYKFNLAKNGLKVPHMGWQHVTPKKKHELIEDMAEDARFYFVHSYYVDCNNKQDELLTCEYGITFTCAVQNKNIMGVQFHPEKSHKYGMHIFKNFLKVK